MSLPQKIYVREEEDGDGGTFLNVSKAAAFHAEVGERIPVGIYQLVDTGYVAAPAVLVVGKEIRSASEENRQVGAALAKKPGRRKKGKRA